MKIDQSIALAAIVVPVGVALLAWIISHARRTVTYQADAVGFSGAELKGRKIVPEGEWFTPSLQGIRLELRNTSLFHLENVRVFCDLVDANWVAKVVATTSVAKETVAFVHDGGVLSITVADLPRREKVTINVIHTGIGGSFVSIRGGGNRFRLKALNDYRSNRVFLILAAATIGLWITQTYLRLR